MMKRLNLDEELKRASEEIDAARQAEDGVRVSAALKKKWDIIRRMRAR